MPEHRDRFLSAKVLDAIDANIAVLNSKGMIVMTNKAWRDFALQNQPHDDAGLGGLDAGANYLGVCENARGYSSENALLARDGIRAVLQGRKRTFSLEYPCHSADKNRWFLMRVKAIPRSVPREVVVVHFDVSDRYLAELQLVHKQQELEAALLQLQEVTASIGLSLRGLKRVRPLEEGDGPAVFARSKGSPMDSLSKREMDVLSGLVRGERNSAIATRLSLSRKSVSTYRSRIFEKLGVDNNVELVTLVSRIGTLRK